MEDNYYVLSKVVRRIRPIKEENAWKLTAVCKQNCVNTLTNKGLQVCW